MKFKTDCVHTVHKKITLECQLWVNKLLHFGIVLFQYNLIDGVSSRATHMCMKSEHMQCLGEMPDSYMFVLFKGRVRNLNWK